MNKSGSVSLYALLVIVPIILFLGLTFDILRIKAMEARIEKSAQAATRSVLSAYDRKLRDQFGLFGLAASASEQAEIARLASGLKKVSVVPIYSLADHRLFRRQVMEEMKVKAPIEFTRHAYDKWKEQAPVMERAPKQYAVSEQAERWIIQREDHLREAFDKLTVIKQLLGEGKAVLGTPLPEDESDGSEEGNELSRIDDGSQSIFTQLQSELGLLSKSLDHANEVERQLQVHIAANDEESELLSDIAMYGSEYFSPYKLGASNAISMYGAAMSARSNGSEVVDTSFDEQFASFYAGKEAEENARRSFYDDLKRRKEEARYQTRNIMDEVKDTLVKHVCSPGDEQHYLKLNESFHRYIAINTSVDDSGASPYPAAALDQSSEQLQKGSFNNLSSISSVMKNIRDETYINEYIFMYFNNRISSRTNRPMLVDVNTHLLRDQEMEYILYGLKSCSANRAAAYAELFATRFAVRAVEALLDIRKTAGSPMLILLTAAAEGALRAQHDLMRLIDGESVPVFAKFPKITMDYTDYMRTFMSIHSLETKKMARMQALIELNTGVPLDDRPVYIRTDVSASMRLWMFPTATRALTGKEGASSSAIISKSAAMAY